MSFGPESLGLLPKIKGNAPGNIASWLQRVLALRWYQRLLAARGKTRAITDRKSGFAALQHDRLTESVKPFQFIQI
jgi:hypothetical protein